jgi:hypothetical protein
MALEPKVARLELKNREIYAQNRLLLAFSLTSPTGLGLASAGIKQSVVFHSNNTSETLLTCAKQAI